MSSACAARRDWYRVTGTMPDPLSSAAPSSRPRCPMLAATNCRYLPAAYRHSWLTHRPWTAFSLRRGEGWSRRWADSTNTTSGTSLSTTSIFRFELTLRGSVSASRPTSSSSTTRMWRGSLRKNCGDGMRLKRFSCPIIAVTWRQTSKLRPGRGTHPACARRAARSTGRARRRRRSR